MVAAVSTSASQVTAAVVGIYPSVDAEVSGLTAVALTESDVAVEISQIALLVLATGRVNDPVVRAWTFTLDGHDFYVLKLGNQKTLIYDTHAEAWYNWGSGEGGLWRAYNGCNWQGGDTFAGGYGSNVVVGDDGNGSLYFLDPDAEYDDDALFTETPRTFERVVQGLANTKGYAAERCFGVYLEGSRGNVDNDEYTDVTLSISDDQGNTYTDVGTISITPDDPTSRVHWRSLGSMRSPGRLFKIVDNGALARIDSLTLDDGMTE